MTDCYCEERQGNPALAADMADLPDGYCGHCDVCGAPGHTRAHPALPVSGAWCDRHWAELVRRRRWTPAHLLQAVVMGLLVLSLVSAVWRMVG